MSEIAVRRQAVTERRHALREIAKERAGIQDTAPLKPYLEEDERGQQGTEGGMPFEQISPEKIILERGRDEDSAFNWTQIAPFKREKEKHRPLNTATIWMMARKEIAQVWREARGVKKKNPAVDLLEREAAMWGERQEEERMRKEQARAEFEQQKVRVDEVLKIIGEKLLEEKEKDNLTAEKSAALIEDAFGVTGKVYDVEWREDGCDICFEPWEERWPRQKRGEPPVIHRIRVDDKLEMVSYDLVEDEEGRQKVQEVMLTNQLKESADEEPLAVDEDDEDIRIRIEKRIETVGRLIELKKMKESAWLATVELWDQMKIRNVERKGEGPIESETIVAKVVDGTIVTSHVQGKKSGEEKEESKFESGTAQ